MFIDDKNGGWLLLASLGDGVEIWPALVGGLNVIILIGICCWLPCIIMLSLFDSLNVSNASTSLCFTILLLLLVLLCEFTISSESIDLSSSNENDELNDEFMDLSFVLLLDESDVLFNVFGDG